MTNSEKAVDNAEKKPVVKKGHPKGLILLFITEMAERFSYYGMRAIFVMYLYSVFFTKSRSSQIYGSFTGLVYLTPILGGYISDRYWGNRKSILVGAATMGIGQFLLFFSSLFSKQSIFKEDGPIDPNVNNTLSIILMYLGLIFIILGNGFFKPNISTMLGDLYEPVDSRKDAAFTIFYMGINLGAFFSPLICGSLGESNWENPNRFKWGFFAAGVGMVISGGIFALLKDKYLVTPEGLPVGLPPAKSELLKEKNEAAKLEEAPELLEKTEKKEDGEAVVDVTEEEKDEKKVKNSPIRLIGSIFLGIVLIVLFSLHNENISDYISAIIYGVTIALPIYIITDRGLSRTEKSRIGVIYIIAVFVIFFWSAFEQAGSSLTIFADKNVHKPIIFGKWEFLTSWFQSVNPVCVIIFAPVMAALWQFLNKYNLEPFSPVKQAIGLALLSIGYILIAVVTHGVKGDEKVSWLWLIALYFLHTIGELCLSPIGLSMVSKLSPARLASLLMGVWFMSNAASNIFAGKLATLLPEKEGEVKSFIGYKISNLSQFFTLFAVMSGVAAILLFALCPLFKRMMKGIK